MKRTLGWNVEAALYLFLVSIIFTSMTAAYSTSTGGRFPGDPSPAQDIVIDGGKHAMRGETLEPPGDIVVKNGGTIVIEDSRIIFNHTGYYEHGILLEEGASLELRNSSVVALDNMFYLRVRNSSLTMVDSELRRTHVICENRSRISISGSYLWALHCLNETVAHVADSKLCYLFLIDGSIGDVDDCKMIEILLYDDSMVNVSDSTLRFIYYLDEGRANIENCDYEDEIRFKPMMCELDVSVFDTQNQPVAEAMVTLTRYGGEQAASTTTDERGSASFTGMEEGSYNLTVTKEGYEELEIERPLLDETQSETVQIHASPEDSPINEWTAPLSAYTVTVLAVTGLLYYIWKRLHGS
jgi:hypothetical protein